MSYIPNQISYLDGINVDEFQRLRTSSLEAMFEATLLYGDDPVYWDTSVSGTGALSAATQAQGLTTGGTVSGALIKYQTHIYYAARTGKSVYMAQAFVFGTAVTGLRRRAGWFDDDNGLYLEQISTGFQVAMRSDATGSVVNTATAQASWNKDKLDGTGASGLTLGAGSAIAMFIDIGDGRARFGFVIAGTSVIAHELALSTGGGLGFRRLPLRFEIENTGTTVGTNTMTVRGAAFYIESGIDAQRGSQKLATAANTALPTITTRRPLVSVRPKLTFNSLDFRGVVEILSMQIISDAGGGILYWEVVRNTTLTGAAFASVGTDHVSEFDTAATALAGGDVLVSGFINAGTTSPVLDLGNALIHRPLANDFACTTADIITIAVTKLSGGATTASASILWQEQR